MGINRIGLKWVISLPMLSLLLTAGRPESAANFRLATLNAVVVDSWSPFWWLPLLLMTGRNRASILRRSTNNFLVFGKKNTFSLIAYLFVSPRLPLPLLLLLINAVDCGPAVDDDFFTTYSHSLSFR